MLRICRIGHITGYRKCSLCGAPADNMEPLEQHHALSKPLKRAITQSIRDQGGVPVADMRRSFHFPATRAAR